MKKLLLLVIVLSVGIPAASLMGQSLQILDSTGNVSNGTIYHVWGDTGVTMDFEGIIDVKNISSNSVTIKLRKRENILLTGTEITMCWAGYCFPANVNVSPTDTTLAPNEIAHSFSGHYYPANVLGESIVTFIFFNVNNINDSAWIVVHFNASSTIGIDENTLSNVNISNPYPNPAASYTSINYSLPVNTVSAKFILCDLLGSKVEEIAISDRKDNLVINTSQLNNGIYLYSLYVNGKMISTKKLVVNH